MKQISPAGILQRLPRPVATLGVLGASATTASAYQGNMEHALAELFQAVEALRQATPNKGSHRAKGDGPDSAGHRRRFPTRIQSMTLAPRRLVVLMNSLTTLISEPRTASVAALSAVSLPKMAQQVM